MAYVEGKPKTKSSARVLDLSLVALEMLKHLKAQEPEGYDGYLRPLHGAEHPGFRDLNWVKNTPADNHENIHFSWLSAGFQGTLWDLRRTKPGLLQGCPMRHLDGKTSEKRLFFTPKG